MKSKIKSNALVVLVIVLLAFLVFGCKSYHMGWAYNHQNEVCKMCNQMLLDSGNVIIVTRDTTKKDSAGLQENNDPNPFWFKMYSHCSDENKVILDSIVDLNKKLQNKPGYTYKYIYKDGKLDLKVWQDSIQVLNRIIEIKEKELKKRTIIEPIPVKQEGVSKNWRTATLIVSCVLLLFIILLFNTIKSAITKRIKDAIEIIKED